MAQVFKNPNAVELAPAILVIDRNTEVLHQQTVISVKSLVLQFSKEVLASILLGARLTINGNVSGSIRNNTALLIIKLAEMSVEGIANEFTAAEIRELVQFLNEAIIFLMTAQDEARDEKIWAAKTAVLDLREALLLTVIDRIDLRKAKQDNDWTSDKVNNEIARQGSLTNSELQEELRHRKHDEDIF